MKQTEPFAVAEHGGWRGIRLPYRGGRFAMDVIMPEHRATIDAAPPSHVLAAFDEALAAQEPQLVALALPRFEIDYETELGDPLAALGLTLPFDPNRADLSAMAEPGQRPLYVKDARHITKLQVYEDGTKAAAVTMLRVVPTALRIPAKEPIPFVVDRPFVVVMRDLDTGLILFIRPHRRAGSLRTGSGVLGSVSSPGISPSRSCSKKNLIAYSPLRAVARPSENAMFGAIGRCLRRIPEFARVAPASKNPPSCSTERQR